MKIWYKEIKALGFKEQRVNDEIYEDQYGFPYKIIQLKLSKKYYLDWDQVTRECVLIKHKKGWIKSGTPIVDLEHLKAVIEHFRVSNEGRRQMGTRQPCESEATESYLRDIPNGQ